MTTKKRNLRYLRNTKARRGLHYSMPSETEAPSSPPLVRKPLTSFSKPGFHSRQVNEAVSRTMRAKDNMPLNNRGGTNDDDENPGNQIQSVYGTSEIQDNPVDIDMRDINDGAQNGSGAKPFLPEKRVRRSRPQSPHTLAPVPYDRQLAPTPSLEDCNIHGEKISELTGVQEEDHMVGYDTDEAAREDMEVLERMEGARDVYTQATPRTRTPTPDPMTYNPLNPLPTVHKSKNKGKGRAIDPKMLREKMVGFPASKVVSNTDLYEDPPPQPRSRTQEVEMDGLTRGISTKAKYGQSEISLNDVVESRSSKATCSTADEDDLVTLQKIYDLLGRKQCCAHLESLGRFLASKAAGATTELEIWDARHKRNLVVLCNIVLPGYQLTARRENEALPVLELGGAGLPGMGED